MMVTLPRRVLVALGAVFSAYIAFLCLASLHIPASPVPALLALACYVVAMALSLSRTSVPVMPLWLAWFDLAVALVVPTLAGSQLDPAGRTGFATWYVAGVGTLMTVAVLRRRVGFAWAGTAALVVQSVMWGGPVAIISAGAFGSVMWVLGAELIRRALARAAQDIRRLSDAGREAAQWGAEQDAHRAERERLQGAYRMAAPVLEQIVAAGGALSAQQRDACRLVESAIRDEIRGRALLDEGVRREVREARLRGAQVTLLDEGGLEALDERDRDAVLSQVAAALRSSSAHKYVVRTVPRSETVAVTVVGLTPAPDGGEDDVELWLEIARPDRSGR